ncbi:hypothetical protein Xets_00899 [Xenorhabdus sp. TS4]|nr:hypothetical protein [Xenorhabdus sp. TS4]
MAARVGAEKTALTSRENPCWRNCSIRLTTSREWPPSSKKLSWRPTCSSSRIDCQTAASFCSVAPCGALYSRLTIACRSGAGSALRSSLPLADIGKASSITKALGSMYSSRRVLSCSRKSAGFSVMPVSGIRYATKRLSPVSSSRAITTASLTPSQATSCASISPSSRRKPRSLT